jgi:hypothetical protein
MRVVDMHGFVSVDTNRYSVPKRFVGQAVAVYKGRWGWGSPMSRAPRPKFPADG